MDRLGHYQILEPIGKGGMGMVYRARDVRLGRVVALKVLPEAGSEDPARRARFLTEARACASLLHPNIATLFEFGEAERPHGPPRLFLAMEYVEGEDLSTLLAAGPLPIGQALAIARQLAAALAAAHRHGVIHRDLKPGNVRLEPGGRVKVLDFGLAKLVVTGDATVEDGFHTREGVLMGTPPYLAPEQARGQKVDERADLYSLGVILFEMLTGRRPWKSRDFAQYLYELESNDPVDVRNQVPVAEPRLVALVERLLRKEPETRLQSAAEAEKELGSLEASWSAMTGAATAEPGQPRLPPASQARSTYWTRRGLVALAALLGVLFGAAIVLRLLPDGPPASPDARLELAVAPFDNLTGDRELDFVARGMSLALSGDLANLPDAHVVDSAVAAAYTHTSDPRLRGRLATDHGVDQLVRGRIQREGTHMLVSIDLVDLESDRVSWSRSFEGDTGELLALQEKVVRGVAAGLRDRLSTSSRDRLEREPTSSNEAYEAHLRGLQFAEDPSGPGDLEVAIHFFERALELDPHFVFPRIQLAEALLDLFSARRDTALLQRARDEAQRAFEARRDLADARLVLARALRVSGEPERARELLGDLGDPTAVAGGLAESQPLELLLERAYQMRAGDSAGASALFTQATETAPDDWRAWSELGIDSMLGRRYDNAEAELGRALELAPENQKILSNLAAVLLRQAKYHEVVALAAQLVAPISHASLASNVGFAYYQLGDLTRAESHFRLAARLRPSDDRLLANLGDVLQRLGQSEAAQREYLGALALVESRLRAFPELPDLRAQRALLLAKGGRCEDLAAFDLSGLPADEPTPLGRVAKALALCDDRSGALDYVAKTLAAGESPGVLAAAEELASLHDDPGFRRMVASPP
ncbi:MAG TPA: protein kinase [Thermoanaerobaculia bacterium]|nr:protein kinase [Thermoanaerobaculia bacterium]